MLLLGFKIFIARILDVSIGVVRTIYIVKGNKVFSCILAFLEILIWLYAAKYALTNSYDKPFLIVSYALGYTAGTFIGILINDYFVKGVYSLKIVSNKLDTDLLKNKGYGLSKIKLDNGMDMIFIDIDKKKYGGFIKYVKTLDNKAFITVSESKISFNGYI